MTRSHSGALAAAVLLGSVFGVSNFAAAIDTNSPSPPAAQTTPAPGLLPIQRQPPTRRRTGNRRPRQLTRPPPPRISSPATMPPTP